MAIDSSISRFASMSLNICSLNSGSNGNCYYIGNDKDAVLVDAGISCRETETRMKGLGLLLSSVKAIFISHEHTDHISGLAGISKKYNLPVFISPGTLSNCRFALSKNLVSHFNAGNPVSVGSLSVTAFRKSHDARDPHSFIVSANDVNVGVFTDIGYPGKDLIRFFKQCHAAFLEANYCELMLENGSYPRFLKNRISGKQGHLSNTQALELFTKHRAEQLSHLILSHLSENNNDPGLVSRLFSAHARDTKIIVAPRYEASPVYTIIPIPVAKKVKAVRKPQDGKKQLSLF